MLNDIYKENFMKKIGKIGGIFSGIVSIIFSFVVLEMDIGGYSSYQTYGGDAYTGIQNASAQAANNVFIFQKLLEWDCLLSCLC